MIGFSSELVAIGGSQPGGTGAPGRLGRTWLVTAIGLVLSAALPLPAQDPVQLAKMPPPVPRRTAWTTSRVIGSPDPPPPYTTRRAFAQLTFEAPVHLVRGPGGRRLFVTQRDGRIVSFADRQDVRQVETFLKLDQETYSLAFHPRFHEHRFVYVFTNNRRVRPPDSVASNQILRYEVSRHEPPRALADSRSVVLQYPSDGHNGGDLAFGPDGLLYITSGDGSSDSDAWNTGQDLSDLTSGILRIDVDNPQGNLPYGIPDDNPFLKFADARPELYAYGMRNPWRFSFDAVTGNLYVGDVGQDLWEMIYLVRAGGNYGWSINEGSHPFHPLKQKGPTPILPPLAEHHHTESRSITGGLVYRAGRLADLTGAYIYGDYETGKIWGLRHEGDTVTWQRQLADSTLRPCSFAVGSDGRFYLVAHLSGEIHELVPAPPRDALPPFPERLSETGLFASLKDLTPSPGVVGYSVNVPQWCDTAHAQRHLALPGTGQMTFAASGHWTFPEGTVLVKTLIVPPVDGALGSASRRIETQLLTLQQGQWSGYSYVWNDTQDDARLAPAEGQELPVTIVDPDAASGSTQITWRVVSRTQCMVCHSRAAGFVLGVRTAQLNRVEEHVALPGSQLERLETEGLFTERLADSADSLDRLVAADDTSASLNARARSYLDANCAHCHVGAGGGNALITLKRGMPLEKTKLVGSRPLHADFNVPGAMLVAPGDPERSVLYLRVSRRGVGQMPPLATQLVDRKAVRLLHDWITHLSVPAELQAQMARAAAEIHGSSGMLTRWHIAGPLSGPPPDNILRKMATGVPAAAAVGMPSLSWKVTTGAGPESRVSLAAPATGGRHWLARSDIIVPETIDAQMLARADAGLRVWLQDELVFQQRMPAASGVRPARFDVTLHEGRNRILVLLETSGPKAAFSLNFRRRSASPRHEQLAEAALSRTGDPERGRRLFFSNAKVQCAKCHRVGAEGGRIGPDLTHLGSRLSLARIIESILQPSRIVAPRYQPVSMILTDGRVRSGIALAETSDTITLGSEEGRTYVVAKSQIASQQVQPRSLMPEGLHKTLTDQQFIDLIAFLTVPATDGSTTAGSKPIP